METSGRRLAGALAFLLAAALAGMGGLALTDSGEDVTAVPRPLVEPIPEAGAIWPYTSRTRNAAGRTLALNVIAVGDAGAVRTVLERVPGANWTDRPYPSGPVNRTAPLLEADGDRAWIPARGAARWGYVRPPGEAGRWLGARYQLFDGTYLGSRDHLRAYVVPGSNVTAVQVHAEYWDWFRLRHTVTSTERPRHRLERRFREDPRVESVGTVRLGTEAAVDSEGTATLLRLASLAGAIALVGLGRRRSLLRLNRASNRSLGLLGATGGLYVLVRLGGIGLENFLPAVSPKLVAAGLYPILALGLPLLAWRLAPGARPTMAGLATGGGFALALGVEHLVLGVPPVALELVLHRTVLILSLGTVATGSAATGRARRRSLLAVGGGAWLAALLVGLFGAL